MKLLNFNIIKLTISLALGIIIAHKLPIDLKSVFTIMLILIIATCGYWFSLKNKIQKQPIFGFLVLLSFIAIGATAYTIKDLKNSDNHYTQLSLKEGQFIEIRITERLKPDIYNDKYIAKVLKIEDKSVVGSLLINVKSDSTQNSLEIDDKLVLLTSFREIQKPLNPHQFDYSEYLKLKQVYHQIYLDSTNFKKISTSKNSIYGYADQLRSKINSNLVDSGFKKNVLSIINALLLGQRQTIDKSIYNNYVNSGTIHILAVSGLHVGILLWILNFIFSPLLHLRQGRVLRPLIIVILLWSFAVIAGLSPSVTRAVTMFSVISIAMHLKRPTNIYNTLFISAFLILLIKPRFLFEVGFQLSYLAVFGIVSIQPMLYKLWNPKFVVIDKLWQIFTVTLAAQIGVVPISLFYFHQFPGLFFISNLVVIPFLSIILGFGLLVIILSLLNYLPSLVVDTFSLIIESLNEFIAWIAQFESFLLRDIPFTLIEVIIAYIIIVSFVQALKKKTFGWLFMTLTGIIVFQSLVLFESHSTKNNSLIVFNKSRFTMIGLTQGNNMVVHHNLTEKKRKSDKTISNYLVGEGLSEVLEDSLKSFYHINNKKLLVIDSICVYKNLSFKPDLILLRNSPKLNLNRLIDSIRPQLIIADASNYKSYARRWKNSCKNKKIPFHYTNEKGAFILK